MPAIIMSRRRSLAEAAAAVEDDPVFDPRWQQWSHRNANYTTDETMSFLLYVAAPALCEHAQVCLWTEQEPENVWRGGERISNAEAQPCVSLTVLGWYMN